MSSTISDGVDGVNVGSAEGEGKFDADQTNGTKTHYGDGVTWLHVGSR